MPKERCMEIDDPVDLQVAAVLLRDMLKRQKIDQLPEIIEAVVFDFDGVFTDNRVVVSQDGTEAVICNRSDGMGIPLLQSKGIKLLVLSTEKNPVVAARCKKLHIECINGADNKLAMLIDWQKKNKISPANIVYVGNDVNDSTCLQTAGCGIVPADAHSSVKPLAQIVLENAGGLGAVREVAELVLEKQI
jgi:N-acylneuraminate cytidylyltransferase